jgi:hypothetical protein
MWETFKQYVGAWESNTAKIAEQFLRSPLVLSPAATMLTAAMRTKALADKNLAAAWGALGLPTRRDQERTLHALHEIQSRLFDLEERLERVRTEPPVVTVAPAHEAQEGRLELAAPSPSLSTSLDAARATERTNA